MDPWTKDSFTNYHCVTHNDIRAWDDDQTEALETLRLWPVGISRCLFVPILIELGIANELMKIVRHMRCEKLFFL